MRNRFTSLIVVLVAVSAATYRPVLAQGPAKVAPMHFHHVHLNSVNPKAAAEYYPKPFALSATKTTFNGYEAVKTGNVYLLFTKVNTPPLTELNGPQYLGVAFRLEYAGFAQVRRKVPREGPENRADVGRRRRQARRHVERHAAGAADAGADPRNASQGHAADPGGRLRVSAGSGRRDDAQRSGARVAIGRQLGPKRCLESWALSAADFRP